MIALYQGRSWVSTLIKWFTWSKYSHSAWICEDGSVIEAWITGWFRGEVRHVPSAGAQHTAQTGVDVFDVAGMSMEQRDRVERFLKLRIGDRYDFRGALGFVLRRDRMQEQRKWFCSELIFSALAAAGCAPFARIAACRVSPGLLAISPLLRPVRSEKTEPMEGETPVEPSACHACLKSAT